jgi:hypothetical protein
MAALDLVHLVAPAIQPLFQIPRGIGVGMFRRHVRQIDVPLAVLLPVPVHPMLEGVFHGILLIRISLFQERASTRVGA